MVSGMRHFYYDRQGRPISSAEVETLWMQDRRVALTDLGRLGRVSTVWLGIDHGYGEGPPLIFETMIFGGPMDQHCDRYSTEEQARTGHDFMVIALTVLDMPKPSPLIHNGKKPRK